ncbi:MAG: ATP synthase F1 subunit delta [SAR324 cluster bacterium]|nr:ATP synthase F1 subunit delta [SAR324 cluster bacterium]
MSGSIVGRRYAKALLSLAGSNENIEKIGEQLKDFADLFEENLDLRNLILDPKISKENRIAVIGDLATKMSCHDLVNKYCRYLTARNRFDIIADISSAYHALASSKLGKATAKIVVAEKLAPKNEKRLQKQLAAYTGKKITLAVEVDASILGGAITSIDSLVLDGSIKNKLNLIRETLSKGK